MQNRSSQQNPSKGDMFEIKKDSSPSEEIINSQQSQNKFVPVIAYSQIPQDPILRLKKKNSRNTTPEVVQIPAIISSYEQLQNIQQKNGQSNDVLKKSNLPLPSNSQILQENRQILSPIQMVQILPLSKKTSSQQSPRSYSVGFTPVVHCNIVNNSYLNSIQNSQVKHQQNPYQTDLQTPINQFNHTQTNIHNHSLNHSGYAPSSPYNGQANSYLSQPNQPIQQVQGGIQQVNGLKLSGNYYERNYTTPSKVNQVMQQSTGAFESQNSHDKNLSMIQSRSQILNVKISQYGKVLNGKDDKDIPLNPLKKITQKPLLNKTSSSLVFDATSNSAIPSITQLPNALPPQIPLPQSHNTINSTPKINRVNNHLFHSQQQYQPSSNTIIQSQVNTITKSVSPIKNSNNSLDRERKQSPEKLLSTIKPYISMKNSQVLNSTKKSLQNLPSNHALQDSYENCSNIQQNCQFQSIPSQSFILNKAMSNSSIVYPNVPYIQPENTNIDKLPIISYDNTAGLSQTNNQQLLSQIEPPTINSNSQIRLNSNSLNAYSTISQYCTLDNAQPEQIKQTSSILEENTSSIINPMIKTSQVSQKEQIDLILQNQNSSEFEKLKKCHYSSPAKKFSIEQYQETEQQQKNVKEQNLVYSQYSGIQNYSSTGGERERVNSQINISPNKQEGNSISSYKNSQILLRNTIDQIKSITKFSTNNIESQNNNPLIEQKSIQPISSINNSQQLSDINKNLNENLPLSMKTEMYQKRLLTINTQIDEIKRKNLDSTKNIELTLNDLLKNEQYIEQQFSEFKTQGHQNLIDQKLKEFDESLKQSGKQDTIKEYQLNNQSSEKILDNLEQFQEKQKQLQQQQLQLQQQQFLLQNYQSNQQQQFQQIEQYQYQFQYPQSQQNQLHKSQQQNEVQDSYSSQQPYYQYQQLEQNQYQNLQQQQNEKQYQSFQEKDHFYTNNMIDIQYINEQRLDNITEEKSDAQSDNDLVKRSKNLTSSNSENEQIKKSKNSISSKGSIHQVEDILISQNNQNINIDKYTQQNIQKFSGELNQQYDLLENEQIIIQQLTQQPKQEIKNSIKQFSPNKNNKNTQNIINQFTTKSVQKQADKNTEIAKKLSETQNKISSNLYPQRNLSSPSKNSPIKKKDNSSPLRRIKNEIKKSFHEFQESKNNSVVHKTMANMNHNQYDSQPNLNEISESDANQKSSLLVFKADNDNSSQLLSIDSSLEQLDNLKQQKPKQSGQLNNKNNNSQKNIDNTQNNSFHNKSSQIIHNSQQQLHTIPESIHSQNSQLNSSSSNVSSTRKQHANQIKNKSQFKNLNQGFATSSRESIMQQFMYLNSLTNKKQSTTINTQPDFSEKPNQNDHSLTQTHLKRPSKTTFTNSQSTKHQTQNLEQKKTLMAKKDLKIEVDTEKQKQVTKLNHNRTSSSIISSQDRSLTPQGQSNLKQTMNQTKQQQIQQEKNQKQLIGKSNTPKFSEKNFLQTQELNGISQTISTNNQKQFKKQESNQSLDSNYQNRNTQQLNQQYQEQNSSLNGMTFNGQQLLEKIQNHLNNSQNELQTSQKGHLHQEDQEVYGQYNGEDDQYDHENEDNEQIDEADLQYYSNPQINYDQSVNSINKQSQLTQQNQSISSSINNNAIRKNSDDTDEQNLYEALNDLNSRLKEKTNKLHRSVERSYSGQLNSQKFLSQTPERAVTEVYEDKNWQGTYSQNQFQVQKNTRLNKSDIQLKQKNSSYSPMKGSYISQQQQHQQQLEQQQIADNKRNNKSITPPRNKQAEQELKRVFDVYSQQSNNKTSQAQEGHYKSFKQSSLNNSQSPVKQPQYIQKKGVNDGHKKNNSMNIKQLNYKDEYVKKHQNQQEQNIQPNEEVQPKKKTYSGMHFKKQVYTIVKDVDEPQQQQTSQSQIQRKESKESSNNVTASMKERSFEFWAEKIKNSDNPKQILDVWKMINSANKTKQ